MKILSKIKYFLIIFGFVAIILIHKQTFKNPLLNEPTKITVQELNEKIKTEPIQFLFSFPKGEYIKFIHKNNKNGMEIKINETDPHLYFGDTDLFEDSKNKSTQNSLYLLMEPLNLTKHNPKPKTLSIPELAEFIKNKKIIFYTGAGISATQISTMKDLEAKLQINNNEDCLQRIIKQPLTALQTFSKFCSDMQTKSPTKAHTILSNLANFKKTLIFTENLDSLHEKTGILPQRIDATKIKNEISTNNFKEIDAIICLGLSHDDRGFLAWYKRQNPKGVLIAIDFVQPEYLGNKDFLIFGDIQEVLPILQSIILY